MDQFPIVAKDPEGGPPRIFKISKKDKDIIDAYIDNGSYRKVSEMCKVNVEYVQEVIHRPEAATYIQRRFEFAAQKADLTEDKVMAKINMVIESDGGQKFDPSFMKGLELAARVLKLIQPTQNNIAVQVNNPLKEMSDEELDEAIRKRMSNAKQVENPE